MINISNDKEASTDQVKTQADAIIYFLQKLDIEMVDDILYDNITYQDFKKGIFIQKLGVALDEFIGSGDDFLRCYKGFCKEKLCGYRCGGYSFIGNHSNNYMDLIIKVENGQVLDMYECSSFKNLDYTVKKEERFLIDKTKFDFKF